MPPKPLSNWPKRYGFHIAGSGPCYIVSVEKGSTADKAGLMPGDEILEVDEQDVTGLSAEVLKTLVRHNSATIPALGVVSRLYHINIKPEKLRGYGFSVSDKKPVTVARIDQDGSAYRAGMRPGDIILEVNGRPVKFLDSAGWLLASKTEKLSLCLIPNAKGDPREQKDKHSTGSRIKKARNLYTKMNKVFGDDYGKKMTMVGVLKQYAENRDIDIFCSSLDEVLKHKERKILKSIKPFVPRQHTTQFEALCKKKPTDDRSCRHPAYNPKRRMRQMMFQVFRQDKGFGFIIKGSPPVHVELVDTGGPAELAGIVPGDFLVGLNNICIKHFNHDQVSALLQNSGVAPLVEIERYLDNAQEGKAGSASDSFSTASSDYSLDSLDWMSLEFGNLRNSEGWTFQQKADYLLTKKEKVELHKVYLQYKSSRKIPQLHEDLSAVFDTPSKREMWMFLLPRLSPSHQEYISHKVNVPPSILLSLVNYRNGHVLPDTKISKELRHHDKEYVTQSFQQQMEYLLTSKEQSQLREALRLYVKNRNLQNLSEDLDVLFDTPSKQTLWLCVIPVLTVEHQGIVKKRIEKQQKRFGRFLNGLPKHGAYSTMHLPGALKNSDTAYSTEEEFKLMGAAADALHASSDELSSNLTSDDEYPIAEVSSPNSIRSPLDISLMLKMNKQRGSYDVTSPSEDLEHVENTKAQLLLRRPKPRPRSSRHQQQGTTTVQIEKTNIDDVDMTPEQKTKSISDKTVCLRLSEDGGVLLESFTTGKTKEPAKVRPRKPKRKFMNSPGRGTATQNLVHKYRSDHVTDENTQKVTAFTSTLSPNNDTTNELMSEMAETRKAIQEAKELIMKGASELKNDNSMGAMQMETKADANSNSLSTMMPEVKMSSIVNISSDEVETTNSPAAKTIVVQKTPDDPKEITARNSGLAEPIEASTAHAVSVPISNAPTATNTSLIPSNSSSLHISAPEHLHSYSPLMYHGSLEHTDAAKLSHTHFQTESATLMPETFAGGRDIMLSFPVTQHEQSPGSRRDTTAYAECTSSVPTHARNYIQDNVTIIPISYPSQERQDVQVRPVDGTLGQTQYDVALPSGESLDEEQTVLKQYSKNHSEDNTVNDGRQTKSGDLEENLVYGTANANSTQSSGNLTGDRLAVVDQNGFELDVVPTKESGQTGKKGPDQANPPRIALTASRQTKSSQNTEWPGQPSGRQERLQLRTDSLKSFERQRAGPDLDRNIQQDAEGVNPPGSDGDRKKVSRRESGEGCSVNKGFRKSYLSRSPGGAENQGNRFFRKNSLKKPDTAASRHDGNFSHSPNNAKSSKTAFKKTSGWMKNPKDDAAENVQSSRNEIQQLRNTFDERSHRIPGTVDKRREDGLFRKSSNVSERRPPADTQISRKRELEKRFFSRTQQLDGKDGGAGSHVGGQVGRTQSDRVPAASANTNKVKRTQSNEMLGSDFRKVYLKRTGSIDFPLAEKGPEASADGEGKDADVGVPAMEPKAFRKTRDMWENSSQNRALAPTDSRVPSKEDIREDNQEAPDESKVSVLDRIKSLETERKRQSKSAQVDSRNSSIPANPGRVGSFRNANDPTEKKTLSHKPEPDQQPNSAVRPGHLLHATAPPVPPAPPPPPPPLSTGLTTQSDRNQLLTVKRLNWEKLNPVSVENTVWQQSNDGDFNDVITYLDLEQNFAMKSAKKGTNIDRKKEIFILSPKKAYNISILLGHLKLSTEEMEQALYDVDASVLTPELLKQLLVYAPDSDELKKYREFEGNLAELSKPDQFSYQISKVKNYEERLRALFFRATFSEKVEEIQQNFRNIRKAAMELRHSKKLANVLQLILAMGNYLNRGNERIGKASGFRISFLSQIDSTKTSDNKSTFLHVLGEAVLSKFPDCTYLQAELPTVAKAARDSSIIFGILIHGMTESSLLRQVSNIELNNDMQELRKSLQEISNIMEKIDGDNSGKDKFSNVISRFLTQASDEFQGLFRTQTNAIEEFNSMVQYFGEDNAKTTTNEIFRIFSDFIARFDKAFQENQTVNKQQK